MKNSIDSAKKWLNLQDNSCSPWKKLILSVLLAFALQSCDQKKLLGDNYFTAKNGNELLYLYDRNWSHGAPDVPWDDKYRVVNGDIKSFVILQAGYAKDKDHYFHKGFMLTNVDYATFQISDYKKDPMMDTGIVRDKNHVYSFRNPQNIIEGANPETYQKTDYPIGSNYWYKDDKHYFINDTIVKVDYHSFKPITEYIYHDKDNIYNLHTAEYLDKDTYLKAIPESRLMNLKEIAHGILEADNAVFITQKEGRFIKIPVEDKQSIKYFPPDNTYMIIDQKIYCEGEPLADADIASFSVYKYPDHNGFSSYAKDRNHVYYYDDKLSDADPKTVRFVKDGNQNLIKDNQYKWVPQYGSINHFTRKMPAKE